MESPSSTYTDFSRPLSSDPILMSSDAGSTRPGPATRKGCAAADAALAFMADSCALRADNTRVVVSKKTPSPTTKVVRLFNVAIENRFISHLHFPNEWGHFQNFH